MNISKKRDRILEIKKEQAVLEEEKERLLIELQEKCKHETIIETPNVGSAFAPMRMCVICGLEEEGWGCGYEKLNKELVIIVENRDEFYKFRELQPLTTRKIPTLLIK